MKGLQGFYARHGIKNHIWRDGIGDMGHVRACRGLNERSIKFGALKRNVHITQGYRRSKRPQEALQLLGLCLLAIEHQLNKRAIGDQIAVQAIGFHMLKELQAIACRMRQRTIIVVVGHQRNQPGGNNDAARADLHRRAGLVAQNFVKRLSAILQNGTITG